MPLLTRRAPVALLAAVALAALTACGSTVQLTETLESGAAGPGGPVGLGSGTDAAATDGLTTDGGVATDSGGSLAGGSVAGSSGAAGGSTTTGGAAGSPKTGTTGGGAATSSGGGTAVASRPAAGTSVPVSGRGWDKDNVYIGVTTQKDVQTVAASVGANGLDAGDQEAQAKAVVDELNRRGGLFGRKIKLVFKDQQTVATSQDPNTAGAAACTYFTQDRPVIALLNPVTLMDVPSFRSCMAKGKVPLFSASVAAVDAKVGEALAPYFYQSVAPSWDALAPTLMTRLKAQGWFSGWNPRTGTAASTTARVGVLVADDDIGKRIAGVVTRALGAAGSKDPVVYRVASGGDMSGAVLQFSGNGVTHVIATNADLLPFQLAAANQSYRPRYGISTVNAPQAFLESNSPPNQNDGAMGIGWSPSFDVSDSRDTVRTPGEQECAQIMAKGGQTFKGKRLAETVAFAFCDGLRLIAGASTAGGGFTGTQIYDGVLKQSSSFASAFSFATGLGPKRLFVPGAGLDMQWDSSCKCVKYTSTASARF